MQTTPMDSVYQLPNSSDTSSQGYKLTKPSYSQSEGLTFDYRPFACKGARHFVVEGDIEPGLVL